MRENLEHPTKWLNKFKKGVEYEDGEASGRRKDTYLTPTTFDYSDDNKRRSFLQKVMYDIFNYTPSLGIFVPTEIIYDGRREFTLKEVVYPIYKGKEEGEIINISPVGRPLTTDEALQNMEKRVYYNSHFYIKIEDPTRLEFTKDPNYFFLTPVSLGEELSRIKEIRPSHIKREGGSLQHTRLLDDIKKLENIWIKEGFALCPVEDDIDPDRCRYCGKDLKLDPHDAGRYREFCDGECKQKYLRFKKRFDNYIKEHGDPNLDPKKLEVVYKMGITPMEIESQFMTTRCRYCGKAISGDKRAGSEFCDESCKYAFNNRLKKERKINPDLTSEDLVKILRTENTKRRIDKINLEFLERYLRGGFSPDDTSPGSNMMYLREHFGDKFDYYVDEITNRIEKEQREKAKNEN